MSNDCTDWTQIVVVVTGALSSVISLGIGAWLKIELANIQRSQATSARRGRRIARALGADGDDE